MEKKRNKSRIVLILILFLILILIAIKSKVINVEVYTEYFWTKMYGSPINLDTGMINNKYFNIDDNGTEAIRTTEGINKAIRYANKHKIEYIRLQKGKYLINGAKYKNGERGIQFLSNITLDLNESILQHEITKQPGYVICNIENVENVKIQNGILVGDKNTHDYNTISSKHEWGMGIQILGSNNVQVNNLEIYDMIGDGIYISEANNEKSKYVEITNLNIHDNGRQGISIITGDNIKIRDNQIWNIRGCGIDFERNTDTQTCYNVQIYNNLFYQINNPKYAIFVHEGISNLLIFENKLYDAKFQISYPNSTIKVYNNQII